MDPLGTEAMHLVRCNGLQIVFLGTGANLAGDAVERRVDDGGTVFQNRDFIFVLDRARVLHDALTVGNRVAVGLHGQQDLRFDHIDADANLLLVELEIAEDHVEVLEETGRTSPGFGQRAEHRAMCRERVIRNPGAVQFLCGNFGAKAEDMGWPIARDDRVAAHVVDFGRANGRGRRIALVAGIEQQQAVDIEFVHVMLDSIDPILAHAVEIHALLIVNLHHALRAWSIRH
jgi:hypothetical protein